MNSNNQPLVTIICNAYNHEKYIRECLEGFVLQKTSFTYEIIVHDDASTDRTSIIVKEYESKYPNLFNNIYQNINQYTNKDINIWGDIILPKSKGKYIAICDGDDYWTNPLKLQKQVDFLEANVEYGLVHTDFFIYIQKFQKMENYFPKRFSCNSCFYDLLTENNFIGTLTVCFRRQLMIDYFNEIKPNEQNWLLGDLPLWLYIANKSKIHFINEITAVYRRLNESASNFQNYENKINFEQSVYDVRMVFYQKFSPKNIRNKKRIKFLFSTNKLRINLNFNGSFLQFISLFISSLFLVTSLKHFLTVLKLGLLKLSLLVKK